MKRDLRESINHAVDGIVYAFRTERNLKIHIAASLVVLVSCLLVDLKNYELLGVFLLIAMVIVAEMFNTAIEALVNLQTVSHHPLAKIAKDVSAGGVFIACITSVIGGYLIFWEPVKKMLWGESARALYHGIALHYTHGLIVVLTIILVGVMIGKALGRKGTFTRGGLVSGHAAVAFGASTAILVITRNPIATTLAFALALLVAQCRVEANIHRWAEVLTGALLGTVASLIVFLMFYSIKGP